MKKLVGTILLAVLLVPVLGQAGSIKLQQVSIHEYEGCTSFIYPGGSEVISCMVVPNGAAAGDYTSRVDPAAPAAGDEVVVCSVLRNYKYQYNPGATNLKVADVTVREFVGDAPPWFTDLVTYDVLMDVPYYVQARSGPGGTGGTEMTFASIELTWHAYEVCTVTPDPGYVFDEWRGLAVVQDCVPDPTSPTLTVDLARYFLELSTPEQCYLYAAFDAANTASGIDVSVLLQDAASGIDAGLLFDNVTETGHTSLTVSPSGPDVPSGFALGDPLQYFDITTTATYSGDIEISIDFSAMSFTGAPETLRLFHHEGGVWADCTTSIDIPGQTIYGSVTSLSPFAVMEPSVIPAPAGLLLAAIGTALVTQMRRRKTL
ncbi:MAG: hypothetical protein JW741_17915 [Sedimentisphaerales bacterium]|nr:hypothetical protein [Sedimentisphaerales bacterium]